MCGIVGYVGAKQAAPILLEGLSKLEYRGYDSAGLAVRDGEGDFQIVKAKGRLAALIEKTDGGKALRGGCGIGHTRWATHGEPSETNAHPHLSYKGLVVGVHNGIIENYQEIKQRLIRHGYVFHSQTDTEAAINLIEYYLFKYKAGPLQAIAHAMMRIRGSYALELMFTDQPGKIYAARKDSPMIIGLIVFLVIGEIFRITPGTSITSATRKLRSLPPAKPSSTTSTKNRLRRSSSTSTWILPLPKRAATAIS